MTLLHQRMGRHQNGPRPPEKPPTELEGLRFARYQQAKVRQELREERLAAQRPWLVDDTKPLPFGLSGRPQFETFEDPIGRDLPIANESSGDALIQEIDYQLARIWRNNAITLTFVAVTVGAIRVAVDRFDITLFAPWFLELAIIVCVTAACTSAWVAYSVRSVTGDVLWRHHIERARIEAATARRSGTQSDLS